MKWGDWADDKAEVVKPIADPDYHWACKADRDHFKNELMFVHQEIVNLQDRFGSIDQADIAKSLCFGSNSRSIKALYNLDIEHFDDMPGMTKKMLRAAEKLRAIDPEYWLELIREEKSLNDIDPEVFQ
ncbi:MAG: hypothetical protein RR740_00715 [Pseudomonas sp.]